jgi:hypothetical protein
MNAMHQKSQIDSLGLYAVRTEAQYLRYNVTNISGSATLTIDGGQSAISTVDKVAWAMDDSNNSPLHIKLQPQNSGIKQDLLGAFILSDAPTPVQINLTATANSVTIDTQGYQTIAITTGLGLVGAVSGSNDGLTFQPMLGYSMLSGLSTSALAASGNFIFPCLTRYIRVIASAGGQFTYYLRNQPFTNNLVNLQQINGVTVSQATSQLGVNIVNVGGTGTVSGGVAGTLGVGGASAVGVAPTYNPIIAGSIDPGGLGRRLFSDATGRLILNPYSLNVQVPSSLAGVVLTTSAGGNLAPVVNSGFNNQVAISVQDTLQYEGQNHVELLAQLLQEMKILNQQMYELPRVLSTALNGPSIAVLGQIVQVGDEPAQMRNDPSLFDKQQ